MTSPGVTKYSIASSESSRHSGRSFSRTLTTSSSDSYSEVIPENLSFEELANAVETLQQVVSQLELENQIFQAYIEHHDPGLIADMDETLEAMAAALEKLDRARDTGTSETSDEKNSDSPDVLAFEEENGSIVVKHQIPSKLARMINIPSMISIRQTKSVLPADSDFVRQQLSSVVKRRMTLNFERCPRMNFAQRIDISEWAFQQQQDRLKAAVKRANSVGGLLRAKIEALGLRITETRTMILHFTVKFNPALYNEEKPLFAEYFIKDIRGTVVNLDAIMERTRLRIGQLKCYRRKLTNDLAAKRELSESIRPVDIETLKIENEKLTRNIALKTKHLNELKTVSGHATLKVNSNKKRLAELSKKLTGLRNEIQGKTNFIATMEQEENLVIREAQKAERALTRIRERIGKFTAPDILEYVRYKRDVRDLRKSIASLKRK